MCITRGNLVIFFFLRALAGVMRLGYLDSRGLSQRYCPYGRRVVIVSCDFATGLARPPTPSALAPLAQRAMQRSTPERRFSLLCLHYVSACAASLFYEPGFYLFSACLLESQGELSFLITIYYLHSC
jgi:hypothetical protein